MASLPNIAILGDYERALRRFSNWEKLEKQANLTFHHEPLRDEALYEVVKDADAIAIVRDRAPFNEAMIARLPKLKFLMFTGERNGTLEAQSLASRNIPVLLFAGSYNKKKIDLEKSPFMNYQGTGATQWIVGLPLMIVPALVFYGVSTILNSEIAIIVLSSLGIIGIGMRSFLIDKIAEGFQKRKYATIEGFKQQEN